MTDSDEPRPPAKATSKKATAKKATAKKATAKKRAPTTSTSAAEAAPAKEAAAASKDPRQQGPTPTRPTTAPMRDGDDVVRAAAQIIGVFDAQPDLFLAACANPVRGLRDAGIELSPEAERYVALRCRFSPAEAERLEQLLRQVAEHLGDVDVDDDRAVAAALRRAGIPVEIEPDRPPSPTVRLSTARTEQRPSTGRRRGEVHPNRRSVLAAAEALPQVHRWRQVRPTGPDPFERHSNEHPVFGPLLEYRRLSASQPRFASDEVYERLARTKGGQFSEGINITLRVRLNSTDDEDDG